MESELSDPGTRREISLDVQTLLEKLAEKDSIILTLQSKLKHLDEDFAYNIELIYDRDKEIASLTAKIDELIQINREQELENIALRSACSKLSKLEQEKSLLAKRIDIMTSTKKYPRNHIRTSFTPKSRDANLSIEDPGPLHKNASSSNPIPATNPQPLSKMSLDLEKRIQELEQETISKHQQTLSKSPNLPSSSESIEAILSKERELSALIRSLNPYKVAAANSKRSNKSINVPKYGFLDFRKLKAKDVANPETTVTSRKELA